MGAGFYVYQNRVSAVEARVSAYQDSLDIVRDSRETVEELADSLQSRAQKLQVSVVEATEAATLARETAEKRVDSLLEVRDTAMSDAEETDSTFRALGDTLLSEVEPRLQSVVRRRTRLHTRSMEAKDEAVLALNQALIEKDSVIGRQDTLIARLQVREATLDSLVAAKDSINGALRTELRLTRKQRDEYRSAVSASWIGPVFKSPVTHAAAAGIGFIGGLLSK